MIGSNSLINTLEFLFLFSINSLPYRFILGILGYWDWVVPIGYVNVNVARDWALGCINANVNVYDPIAQPLEP